MTPGQGKKQWPGLDIVFETSIRSADGMILEQTWNADTSPKSTAWLDCDYMYLTGVGRRRVQIQKKK